MSGQNTKGNSVPSDSNNDLRSADALDRYNSERTKQILGKMLSEYADDDSKNYFETPQRDDTLFDAAEYMQEVKKQADEFERLKAKKTDASKNTAEKKRGQVSGRSNGDSRAAKQNDGAKASRGFDFGKIVSTVKGFLTEPEDTYDDHDDYDSSNGELDSILGDDSERTGRFHGLVKKQVSKVSKKSNAKSSKANDDGQKRTAYRYSQGKTDDAAKKAAEDIIFRIVGMDDDEMDITEPDYISGEEAAAEDAEPTIEQDSTHIRATMTYKDSVEKIKAALEKDNKQLAEKKSVIEEDRANRLKAEEEENARLKEEMEKREKEEAEKRNAQREKMLAEEKAKEEADKKAREEAAERARKAEEEKQRALEEEQKRLEAEAQKKLEDEQRREENRRKIEAEKQRVLEEENRKRLEEEKLIKEENERIRSSERKNKRDRKRKNKKSPVNSGETTLNKAAEALSADAAQAAEAVLDAKAVELTADKEGETEMRSRDSKTLADDIISAATKDDNDDVQTYEPRRAGTRRKAEKARKAAKKSEKNIYEADDYDDFDDDFDDESSSILPKVEKSEIAEEKTNNGSNKPRKNEKASDKISDIMDGEDYYEDDDDGSNVKVIRIPIGGVLVTLVIIILAAAVTGMGFLCRNYQQRLDDANDEISVLKSNDKSAQYEKQIEDMQVKIDDLTAQLNILGGSAAGQKTTVSAEATTQATTQTTTEETTKSQNGVQDGKYIVQDGDSLYTIAQKVYGDGSRYSEIQDANNISDGSLQIGDELIIP